MRKLFWYKNKLGATLSEDIQSLTDTLNRLHILGLSNKSGDPQGFEPETFFSFSLFNYLPKIHIYVHACAMYALQEDTVKYVASPWLTVHIPTNIKTLDT